jgi:L-ribulose-5-phosphate 3-epimerase
MQNPLAGHTNTYHTYSLEQALQGIAEAGYRCVELSAVPGWTEHVALNGGDELRRQLSDFGLSPVSLSAHSDLTTREGLEHGVRAVRWAGDFGIPIVNTAIGGHASQEEDEAAFLGNVAELAGAAEEAGVVVALEIHGDIMASGGKTLPLLEKIGRESVKVNYDTANVEFYSGKKAVDDLPQIAPYLAHVHLKDTVGGKDVWNFPAIGTGSVDFERVLQILEQAGYSGPFSVELEFQGEPWPPLDDVTESMRRSYETLRGLGLR